VRRALVLAVVRLRSRNETFIRAESLLQGLFLLAFLRSVAGHSFDTSPKLHLVQGESGYPLLIPKSCFPRK
jgi:hypothetical protein